MSDYNRQSRGRAPRPQTQESNDASHFQNRPMYSARPGDSPGQQVFQQPWGPSLGHSSLPCYPSNNGSPWNHHQDHVLNSEPFRHPGLGLQAHQQIDQQQRQEDFELKVSICYQRFICYLYHQSQGIPDNSITYWRKFVAEFYDPLAKKTLCFLPDHGWSVVHHRHETMNAGHCHTCGVRAGTCLEQSFEALANLFKAKYDSGVKEELIYVDLPQGKVLPFGRVMLEYSKAVQHTIYKQSRIIHEGKLRIVFNKNFKILSWQFCAHCQEEVVPRSAVPGLAPNVQDHYVQESENCQGLEALLMEGFC